MFLSSLTFVNDTLSVSKEDYKNLQDKSNNIEMFLNREIDLINNVYSKMIDTIGISVALASLILTGLSIYSVVLFNRTDKKINNNLAQSVLYKKELEEYQELVEKLTQSRDELDQKLKLQINELSAQKILLYAERLRRESKLDRAFEKINEGINFINNNKIESNPKSMMLSYIFEKANINLAKLNYEEALECFKEILNLDTSEKRPQLQICEASLFSYNYDSFNQWVKKIDERKFKYELEYFNCLNLFITKQYDELDKNIGRLRTEFPILDSFITIDWDFKDFDYFIKKHSLNFYKQNTDQKAIEIYDKNRKRLIDLVDDFQLSYYRQ
jgi:tetratricopeptide (TPR) repeat protein